LGESEGEDADDAGDEAGDEGAHFFSLVEKNRSWLSTVCKCFRICRFD
jgi:hypothetical protein